jgi:membrane-bound lytic murein transglycosylase D
MLRYWAFLILFFVPFLVKATPRVPSTLDFAGIRLSINEKARREIQADVDALHRSQTYFNKKLTKVKMYFPIIERVFREENIPEDFKYLVIQESALIPDAVSTSNAVGFWQFKKFTAEEVGLRVDSHIDERMNITASSHGAAKYLKKNNFFFDNWVYALLAYNTGPGGAERYIEKRYMGASKMEINGRTHWYVKKFLAHKIAFEEALHTSPESEIMLYEYSETSNKSLRELADHFQIDHDLMKQYNKWIKRGRIPTDKTYSATIPVSPSDDFALNVFHPSRKEEFKGASRPKIVLQTSYEPIAEFDFEENDRFPIVKTSLITKKIKINGIPGFIASANDNLANVTINHGISEKKFLKFNEMTYRDEIVEGQVYYLKRKKNKAKIHYHVVIPGENAWSISQKYGLKLKKLLTKNRLREEKDLDAGMVMWLRFIRPSDVPVEYRKNRVNNLIVKSSANAIEYPPKDNSIYKQSGGVDVNNQNVFGETTPPILENDPDNESDFQFEEIDNETDYINENSYVDLNNIEDPDGNSTDFQKDENVNQQSIEKIGKKGKKYHIVKPGETLFSISRAYDVSIGKIRQWNDIQDLDVLSVGQRITIYHDENFQVANIEAEDAESSKTYIVKKNDTLYGIARENGLTIKELMDINNKEDFDLQEGEILRIVK